MYVNASVVLCAPVCLVILVPLQKGYLITVLFLLYSARSSREK